MAVSFLVHVSSIPSHPLGERFAFLSRHLELTFWPQPCYRLFTLRHLLGHLQMAKAIAPVHWETFVGGTSAQIQHLMLLPLAGLRPAWTMPVAFRGGWNTKLTALLPHVPLCSFLCPAITVILGKCRFTKLLTGGKFSNRRIHIINEGATTECKTLSLGSDHQCHRKIELHLLYYSFW